MKTIPSTEKTGHTRIQWLMAILANLTLLIYGIQTGWISPMRKILQSDNSPVGRRVTDNEISWIASLPSLCAIPSVFIFLIIVDLYGRKLVILIMLAMQFVSWTIKFLPTSITTLLIARALTGVAAGGCFNVTPMYVKEIAQDNNRGALVSLLTISQNIGIMLVYIMGGYLEYNIILWIATSIPFLTFILFLKAPESPAFLVRKGKLEEAVQNIAYLRGLSTDNKTVLAEIDLFKKEDEYFNSLPSVTYLTIFKHKTWRWGFIIMFLIMVPHGANGAFSMINYAATLLASSGVEINPDLQSLSVPLFMSLGSIITISSVDKIGRKPILIGSFVTSAIMFAYLATCFHLQQFGWKPPGWLNVAAIAIIFCCYGLGICPIPFIVMSELFSFQIRAKLIALLVVTGWTFSFTQLVYFSYVSSHFGIHIVFYGFAIINTVGATVAICLLPETKNKSVEEIEKDLSGRKSVI